MTAISDAPALVWSSQFSVLPANNTPVLKGDKIILPPSALEQLLAASTITVSLAGPLSNSTFDPYNPYSFAAEREARAEAFERQQQLPHPLTFRLVNPQNGRVVFAGIREFSAGSDQVGLSSFLRHSLGVDGENGTVEINGTKESGSGTALINEEAARVTVHVKELPKGTYAKLRPLEAGYDPEDWKALLEKHLRDNFTTLTNGEILSIPAGEEEFRFLVDGLKPNEEAVSLVDTDLEVDIEALNEEQARETLKQRLSKSQRGPGTAEGSSAGGLMEFGKNESGQVRPGEYVDYNLQDWNRKEGIEVELLAQNDEEDLDIFINTHGPRQRSRPRETEYIFGDLSTRPRKIIRIQPRNAELDNSDALWVSVRGYSPPNEVATQEHQGPIQYTLWIKSIVDAANVNGEEPATEAGMPSNSDEERCKNCHQWVPRRTMILHENFCFRNNILCPHCENVFQKSSAEWKTHWHCPHDDAYGNTQSSQLKHTSCFHTPLPCPACGYQASNTPNLAHHRTTTCPGKLILCSFCHLQVPQQGPDEPDPLDPEVILSGLTPHELIDGARTTECHLCAKIVRLRDMPTHLKHHDLQRLSRRAPRICRNLNCGRTIDAVSKRGDANPLPPRNELAVCDPCFGPLYVSMYDPEGKALRRRVERKYLTQLLTGCGQPWCRNRLCKSGRLASGLDTPAGTPITSKMALTMVKPLLERGWEKDAPLYFCTDETSQRRRLLADMLAAEAGSTGVEAGAEVGVEASAVGMGGHALEWCVAALEVEAGDLDRGRAWLRDWAPTRAETAR